MAIEDRELDHNFDFAKGRPMTAGEIAERDRRYPVRAREAPAPSPRSETVVSKPRR